MSKRIFIIGAGRFGYHLATRLSELGCDVTLGDHEAKIVQDLADSGFRTVRLDADDAGDLRAAGVQDADAAVVAIGEHMQASILCTLVLKELGVKHIVARAINDKHAQILEKLGADRVVAPARDSALRLAEQLHAEAGGERIPLAGDFQLAQVKLGSKCAGSPLEELKLPRRHGLISVLLTRLDENRRLSVFRPDDVETLLPGDVLYVVGEKERVNDFEENFGVVPDPK